MKTSRKVILIASFALIGWSNASAQVCFSPFTNYTADYHPTSITTSDLNGDGFADLAVSNFSSNDISILLGTGTGTFGTPTNFAVGIGPIFIINTDFNGDGNPDLATVNNVSNNVSVLLGTGTGSFVPADSFAVGTHPSSITSSDFNGDGFKDLAVANLSTDNIVSVLLGTGTGSFGIVQNFTVGNYPQAIISEDFNLDGFVDIGVTDNGNNLSVLLGNGAGSFGTPTNFVIGGGNPAAVTKADFNGDGFADLAIASNAPANVSVLLGTGTGSFGASINFASGGSGPQSVISADFNGDSKADLAVVNFNSGTISVFLGTGTGSFSSPTNFVTGIPSSSAYPQSVTSGDFNGDGKTDLATANSNSTVISFISVLLNTRTIITISGNTGICVGNSTILTASGASTYTWSTNAGGATTSAVTVSPTTSTIYTVTGDHCANNVATININVSIPEIPNICSVTTDSATNYMYNIVYWNKTLYNNVDSFIVYRYDVMSSTYLRIGAVSKNSLSEFTDNVFNIGGPNGGNPLYSSWQYKLAIRDTCGNVGAMSPYHQSMFVQESGATFSWNAYTVEAGQTNPVTGYSFLRDDSNTGAWHVLVNTAGLSSTDPNYATSPNGNWRVDALGFNCTPTLRLVGNNNTQSTYSKAHSNTSKPTAAGINQVMRNKSEVSIYPNPASQLINLKISQFDNEKMYTIEITDMLGNVTHHQIIKSSNSQIDVSDLAEGVYQFRIQNSEFTINKKVVIVR